MIRLDIPASILADRELNWVGEGLKREMAARASLELYQSREIVFQGRETSEAYYIVLSGHLQVLECGPAGELVRNILYEDDSFGIPFLYGQPLGSECMLVAATRTLVLAVPLAAMRDLILSSPREAGIYGVLSRSFQAYQFLKTATTFGKHLSPEALAELIKAFERRSYEPEAFLIRQGDAADGYYMCVDGLLKVIVEKDGREVFSTMLKSGDYFGELAFLNSAPRSASIKALRRTECFFLSVDSFQDLMKREPRLREGFQHLARLAYG